MLSFSSNYQLCLSQVTIISLSGVTVRETDLQYSNIPMTAEAFFVEVSQTLRELAGDGREINFHCNGLRSPLAILFFSVKATSSFPSPFFFFL